MTSNPNQSLTNAFVGSPSGVLMSSGGIFVTQDGIASAYRYCQLGFATVATPTDILIIQGSATKTIRIKKVIVGGVATAAANMALSLYRRTAAYNSIGTAVLSAITAVSMDTLNAPVAKATAVVSTVGTANFTTVGTSAGILAVGRAELPAVATGVAALPLSWDFTTDAVVLRGAADFAALNVNGAAVPSGAVLDITVELEEDNS